MNVSLKYYPYNLELKHQFTISGSSRSFTPIIITELHFDNFIGYGEASLPPYLKENQQTVSQFLSQIDLSFIRSSDDLSSIEKYVSSLTAENNAAKASVSIALYDLIGKLQNKSARELLQIPFEKETITSYTIGIDSPEIIKLKIKEAEEFKILKVKLGTENDEDIIKVVRSVTDKPLYVDANQGWKNREEAIKKIEFLETKNVRLIEQPFPVSFKDDQLWLKERSPLPLIADESVKTLSDLKVKWELFHGVNIKLMKCGGITAALEIIDFCRNNGLSVMFGCMTETSCAITAAADLAVFADFIDLDGNVLIKNDPFKGVDTTNGKIIRHKLPGFGITPRPER